MKRMLSILAVILLVTVAAQAAEVKSANVAGVINISVTADQYRLVGVKLDDMDTASPTIADILGTDDVPVNTVVYTFDGSDYVAHTFVDEVFYTGWLSGGSPSTTVVDRVAGFWIVSPETHTFTTTGEVPVYATPITLDPGYQLVNYPFPAEKALADTDIGSNAAVGDIIYVFDGSDYVAHTYVDEVFYTGWLSGGSPSDLSFTYGDSFWYFRNSSQTSYDESVPYTL